MRQTGRAGKLGGMDSPGGQKWLAGLNLLAVLVVLNVLDVRTGASGGGGAS